MGLHSPFSIFWFCTFGGKINQRFFFFLGAIMAVIAWIILTYIGFGWVALWSFVIIWGLSAGTGVQAW